MCQLGNVNLFITVVLFFSATKSFHTDFPSNREFCLLEISYVVGAVLEIFGSQTCARSYVIIYGITQQTKVKMTEIINFHTPNMLKNFFRWIYGNSSLLTEISSDSYP